MRHPKEKKIPQLLVFQARLAFCVQETLAASRAGLKTRISQVANREEAAVNRILDFSTFSQGAPGSVKKRTFEKKLKSSHVRGDPPLYIYLHINEMFDRSPRRDEIGTINGPRVQGIIDFG